MSEYEKKIQRFQENQNEQKLNRLTLEVERLNFTLKDRIIENNELREKLTKREFELQTI